MPSFIPSVESMLMPSGEFDAVIARVGQRVSWMKGHTCPCTYGGGGAQGRLPMVGSAARGCKKCFGLGTYWDTPTVPFRAFISFMHMSPTPDEPGQRMDPSFGQYQMSEPSLTLPYTDPNKPLTDPTQPTNCWINASADDMFVPVDMTSRYTAVLQVGGVMNLPYQQNVQIALSGAVAVWDPVTMDVAQVEGYAVDGPTVTLPPTYPTGTNYMVEFIAAPLYVAFRAAGGIPHTRPFDGGAATEPRRFRLQTLDFWTRQRGIQAQASGTSTTTTTAAKAGAFAVMQGRPVPA